MEAIVRERHAIRALHEGCRAARCSCPKQSRVSRRSPPAGGSPAHGGSRLGDEAKSSAGAGSSVGAAVHSDGALDECAEHLMVNVVETFEVEAPLPNLVRTKLPQQLWIPVLNAANEVQNEVAL